MKIQAPSTLRVRLIAGFHRCQIEMKVKRSLKMLLIQEVINKRLHLVETRMSSKDLHDKTTHLGTLTCLMAIRFHVLRLNVGQGIVECMTWMIIRGITKTLKLSLQDHKMESEITFPT